MADIFGREVHDYKHYAALQGALPVSDWRAVEGYLTARAERQGRRPHDFDALGTFTAAADDIQVLGYTTDNLEAMQAYIDEVMYDEYRLPDWIPMLTDIPEGVLTYARRVMDSWGRGAFIESSGSEMPNVGTGLRVVRYPLHYAGIAAQWTLEELRQAAQVGHSLPTEVLQAATKGALEHIETVGLTGDATRGLNGFLTLPANATPSAEQVRIQTAAATLSTGTADEMIAVLQTAVNQIITDTNGIMGRTVRTPLAIYLPMAQYLRVLNTPRSTENDRSVWNFFRENNGWTALSGRQPDLYPIIELVNAAASGSDDRMIVAVKSPLVFEMPMSIAPRAMAPQQQGLTIKVPMEYKIGGVNVLRPRGIVYVDGV